MELSIPQEQATCDVFPDENKGWDFNFKTTSLKFWTSASSIRSMIFNLYSRIIGVPCHGCDSWLFFLPCTVRMHVEISTKYLQCNGPVNSNPAQAIMHPQSYI